jgi:hypothetical protein
MRLYLVAILAALACSAFGPLSAAALLPNDPAGWPEVSRESRPWAYNWWLGSAVDTNNLARELRRYREAGLGGIHIIPIYRAKGEKARSVDFLSPRWMDMLQFSIEEGNRLDLGVDMTTGTGWCFGGPNVPEGQGGWKLQTRTVNLAAEQEFNEKIDRTGVLALFAETSDGKRHDLRDQIPAQGNGPLAVARPKSLSLPPRLEDRRSNALPRAARD